jgi:hypothetical protein
MRRVVGADDCGSGCVLVEEGKCGNNKDDAKTEGNFPYWIIIVSSGMIL